MIDYSVIDTLMQLVAVAVGKPFVRGDQDERPAYPYVTYKIINENVESQFQNVKTYKNNSGDVTLTDKEHEEKSRSTISLNFVGEGVGDWNLLRTMARKTLDYFRRNVHANLVVLVNDTSIDDRSVFIEDAWEYKIGFDFIVVFSDISVATTEGMETIEVTPTVEEVEREKITITKP